MMIGYIMPDGKHQEGFTLIEVLVAMAIIGVGLIALVTLFPVGLRSSRLAGDFTTASFVAQQALDNIRASAQVYDPADLMDENGDGNLFDDPNRNGLGYYDLPVSAEKCYFSPIRFPTEPTRSQWWRITMTSDHDPFGTPGTFTVTNSFSENVGSGTVDQLFKADDSSISFLLYNNKDGPEFGDYAGPPTDRNYEEFEAGDEIKINIEVHAGNPYYWYAMRAPVTEDVDLDGILDGRARDVPNNQIDEDTGLDLVPDYWDKNNNGSYEPGLDDIGETGYTASYDPHGDNRYVPKGSANEVNPNGLEGNGQIDAVDDDDIQKVTVIIGWREGGRDRIAVFSAAIPNQFR